MAGYHRPIAHTSGKIPAPLPHGLARRAVRQLPHSLKKSLAPMVFKRASLGLAHAYVLAQRSLVESMRGAQAHDSCCSLRAELKPASRKNEQTYESVQAYLDRYAQPSCS